MSDIILVQPRIGNMDSFRTKNFPPLALLHSAAVAKQHYNVKIIDQRKEGWKKELLMELKKNPIIIGTTSITGGQIGHSLEISRIARNNSNVPIVWGGIHPTLLPEQTLKNENVDIVIMGEGELTLLELADNIENKRKLKNVRGIGYKENKRIRINKERKFSDLNKLPDVPYDLIKIEEYFPLYGKKKSAAFQSSRGCLHKCSYCYNTVYNKCTWRALRPENVVERIERLKELGAQDIYFIDDNFFMDLNRAKKIAEGLSRLDIEWQVQGVTVQSVKGMNNEEIKKLEKSGLKRITIGAETGSDRIRKLIGKIGTARDILDANKKLSKYNMVVFYSFISGFPTETREELKETIRLMFRIIKDNPNARNSPVYNFIPYPGTKILDIAKEHGFKEPSTLEGWANYEWSKVNVPYVKNKEELERLYFSSIFIDSKFSEYDTSALIKLFALFYRPIARFRVRNQFFRFMAEKIIAEKLQGAILK